jgi:hypothetical protein
MWLYGFGTGISGSLEGYNANSPASFRYRIKQRPKGYKYGIHSINPIGQSNIFRYDKFGHLADMLEQSHDGIFYNIQQNYVTETPIMIKFVSEESESVYKILDKASVVSNTFNSSNLNSFATSSLPYFDDNLPRNRSYQTDTGDDSKTLVTIVRDKF